nr:RNA-directed DNA polymerase, eukaryota [Tanacetum cinerariifolium]
MIHGITKEGVWISNHPRIKEEFLNFFKEKFKDHDLNVDFLPFANYSGLCALDRARWSGSLFGDINVVHNENEKSGSLFSRQDENNFNSFIDNYGLIDLPLRGRLFIWMNKDGTKLSKLDRFLISEEVTDALPDVCITAIDRLWSDHNPILLHIFKSDFGPTSLKLFRSWLLRDSFDEVIKMELPKLEEHKFGKKLLSHEKFRLLKARTKQWHSETKTSDHVTKHDNCNLSKKFKDHDLNVDFLPFANYSGLCALDRDSLETLVSLDEVKNAVWDCGSSKAFGPDRFSFAFVKKY